jgi:hypothetical protein
VPANDGTLSSSDVDLLLLLPLKLLALLLAPCVGDGAASNTSPSISMVPPAGVNLHALVTRFRTTCV